MKWTQLQRMMGGQQPDCFLSSLSFLKVVLVYKNSLPLKPSNYCPISLLSNISKSPSLKLIVSFLTDLVFINCILLTMTYTAWTMAKFLLVSFVDLQKAFYTVNHHILYQKLNYYGIRGIANQLFSSYMSDCIQFVFVASFKTLHNLVRHGVPQGSVLGLLLFLMYIIDLQMICNSESFLLPAIKPLLRIS